MNAVNEVSQIAPEKTPPESQQSEPTVKRWRDSCFVYVVEDRKSKAVKIGIAKNPDGRLASLQVGNPRPLRIYQCYETISSDRARDIEILAHKALASRRLVGEWFDVCPDAACDTIVRVARNKTPCRVSPGYPEPAAGQMPLVSPLVKMLCGPWGHIWKSGKYQADCRRCGLSRPNWGTP